jgi:hypothetical protein
MKKFLCFVLLSLFCIFLLLLSLFLYIGVKYCNWQRDFEDGMIQEYIITSEDIKDVNIKEKATKFILSSKNTEFLELELNEVGSLLFNILDSNIGQDVVLETMYILPEYSKWNIYLQLSYMDVSVWVSFDINKDNMQTIQIYTTSIYIGPFSIGEYGNWIEMINKGVADSIVTLNENGFVGRYLENIELLEESIVIKGSRY